jgi:YHS domain-containing protein
VLKDPICGMAVSEKTVLKAEKDRKVQNEGKVFDAKSQTKNIS